MRGFGKKRSFFGGAAAQKSPLRARLLAPATTRTLDRTQATTEQACTRTPVRDMQASHTLSIVRETASTGVSHRLLCFATHDMAAACEKKTALEQQHPEVLMAGKQLTMTGKRSNMCLETFQHKSGNQWEPMENAYTAICHQAAILPCSFI